ncbi:hypothetical protein DMB92_02360 [Campylobacter sp. MIT 99-7217]|uniref:formyltransferase family protein n=1 Tax=Campylobacter sp. MIT 99-7217 TaxID=535091 RepID=UPI00115B6EAE|nr:formyltransferase family protein [Campylobacter sp. MIT 99-7217]TQR33748.1 hypothetical protein DMB92_02360 [Campylobacter sp. MIT 99-7217]
MCKIIIAGKNQIATNALKYMLKHYVSKDEIVIISNKTDKGLNSWQPSLKNLAKSLNVREISLKEAYDMENSLFISLEFDRLIKTSNFLTKRLYNIHFSKLPLYKGMYTSIMPILYGEKDSGVTLHKINDGIDTGDIIAQKIFDIDINDTARHLYFKYLNNGFCLFKENIEKLLSQNYQTLKQNVISSSYYSKADVDFNDIKINLNKTSFEIHNQIRAFIFKEYQLPTLKGIKIKSSILSEEFIGFNSFTEFKNCFILSGIDGYKITAYKELDFNKK